MDDDRVGALLGIVAGVRGYALSGWGAYLIVRGRRKRARTDEYGIKRDGRRPILDLRPFDSDEHLSGEQVRRLMSMFGVIRKTPLEGLATQFKKLGPFICIGKPGENLPQARPDSLYEPVPEWENTVKSKLKTSKFVVFRAGFNYNTVQEAQWAVEYCGPTRILFWFPRENEVDYAEFRKSAPEYLVVRKNLIRDMRKDLVTS